MRHPAAPLLLPLLLLVGSVRPASAEIAESAYNVVLTGKRTVATAAGDRVQYVRIGTKDVIERFRDTLGGISGRSMRLVVQRPIEDLGLASAYVLYAFVFNLAYDRIFPIEPNKAIAGAR